MDSLTLGVDTAYPESYSAECLDPIARSQSRSQLSALQDKATLPFEGVDIWTAFEVSWLAPDGKPVVAMATFEFDANSANIIESKSFKYYLNSFNQSFFNSFEEVKKHLVQDLSACAGTDVKVRLATINQGDELFTSGSLQGDCIDECTLTNPVYTPAPQALCVGAKDVRDHVLYSHLLKSNCPVTGQPDWATFWVKYSGKEILPESLLAYVISYRRHQDFHENCVERMFCDIASICSPSKLSVYARYTRRGGLDINPFRSNCGETAPNFRVSRQ